MDFKKQFITSWIVDTYGDSMSQQEKDTLCDTISRIMSSLVFSSRPREFIKEWSSKKPYYAIDPVLENSALLFFREKYLTKDERESF